MTALARVAEAYDRLDEQERPEAWIAVRDREQAEAEAADIDARTGRGEPLPLAGYVVAVKDNIDVAGFPTTAGCPSYAYVPTRSAPVAQRLVDAGAIVLGKTNLDQFATGLVGTRSPYGAVRSVPDETRVAGGSSSGSAVAVALGIADAALGTDTAGSGRVPAAFNGIVGLKPTLGLLPSLGVVPACRSYDTVSVFARTLGTAGLVRDVVSGPHPDDARSWTGRAIAGPRDGGALRIAVPDDDGLTPLSGEGRRAFDAAIERFAAAGREIVPVDIGPLLAAGRLLYGGALLAERYAAVGEYLETRPPDADPTVSGLVLAARDLRAVDLVRDQERLDGYRLTARRLFADVHALLVPTVAHHPTFAEVAADPVGVNAALGTFTTFVNLLDLCGVAVPAGTADGSCFGVTLLGSALTDAAVAALAHDLTDTPHASSPRKELA